MIGDEPSRAIRPQHLLPFRHLLLQPREKRFALPDDALPLFGRDSNDGFGNAAGDCRGIGRIEPIMRIGKTMPQERFLELLRQRASASKPAA